MNITHTHTKKTMISEGERYICQIVTGEGVEMETSSYSTVLYFRVKK